MSGYDSSADGNRDRVLILRDSSKGEQEKDELGQFLASVVGVVLETDEEHPELVTESRTGFFQPRNWHHSTCDRFSACSARSFSRTSGTNQTALS